MVTFVTPPTLLPAGPMHTLGNQIVDQNNNPVRITSIGWNGGNDVNATQLEGFPNASFQTHIDNMIRLGFNCARILTTARGVLNGISLLAIYDQMIDYAGTKGFRFIVDIHNDEGTSSGNFGVQPPNGMWYDSGGASNGTDGGGTTGTITDALFLQAWQTLATRWRGKPGILGYDIINEPQAAGHATPGSTWGGLTTGAGIVGVVGSNQDIRAMYQRVGNAIHAIDPNPLIICEGLIDYNCYHPAGDLSGVQTWPVVLNQPNKVWYSTHEYGQFVSVFSGQPYIDQIMRSWGWMIANNQFPFFIGEMGGNMNGSNGQPASTMSSWANTLIPFMNGQWPNTFTFTGQQQGVSSDWWVWTNGDGGETDFTIMTGWTGQSLVSQNAPFMTQLFPFSVPVGPKPIQAPLTGTVTTGTWLSSDDFYPGITLPSGLGFHYNYLLPFGYDPTKFKYPIYIWLHPDQEGNPWYQGDNDTFRITRFEPVAFNTVDFRTKWPCIVIVPYADQTTAGSDIQNWGGWNNTGGVGNGTTFNGETGPNTFALNAMTQKFITNFGVDTQRIYVNGFSLGGIGSEYLMLRYNTINGNPKLYTAGMSTGGVLEIHNFGGPLAADIVTMTNVPVWWVSGQGDGTSKPADWNLPMWDNLSGGQPRPTPLGNPTAASAKGGSSQMNFWYDPNIGHNDFDVNGNFYGVHPTLLNWLFSQNSSGITPPPPPGPASPDGTVVLLGSSASITDNLGNQWTLTTGGVVNINGGAAGFTSGVIEIAWVGQQIYQENAALSWWFWDGANWIATTAPIIIPQKTISCNTVTSLLANTIFTVSGVLTNYPTAPTLKLSDDGGLFVNLPVGNTVSNTRFSFSHAGVLPGNHTIVLQDGANTSIQSPIVTYGAQGNAVKTIIINSLSNLKSNTPFSVSGSLSGYNVTPALTYTDDAHGGANVISTSSVTSVSFNFTHPALLPGAHSIVISDSTNSNNLSYSLTTQLSASPNNSFILIGNTSPLIDSLGNQWTLTSGGQVANNGVIDATTSNVIEMAYVGTTIYQENASALWWGWVGNTWTPPGGSAISPLGAIANTSNHTIIINALQGAIANSPFTVTGTLTNFVTVPTLQYKDDNGPLFNLPSGNVITISSGVQRITPGIGSFTDAGGHVYTLTAGSSATEDGQPMAGGGGTAAMELYQGIVYAQDGTSLNWFIWNETAFVAAGAAPPTTGTPGTPTNFTFNHPGQGPGNHILTVTDGSVSGTLSYSLSSVSVTRNYVDQPGGNKCTWNTPFGDGAVWGSSTDLDTIDARRGGFINSVDNFGCTIWIGKATDPVHTVKSTATYQRDPLITVQLHIPTGAFEPGPPATAGDNPMCFYDPVLQPGKTFVVGTASVNGTFISNLQPGDIITGGFGEVDDATSDIYGEDQETGNYGYSITPGVITGYDVDPLRNPNWPRLQHGLRYSTDASFLKSGAIAGSADELGPSSWPQKKEDGQSPPNVYTGNLVAGTTLGIPINTPMPGGLSFWGQQLFWNAQHYPWLFRDQAGGGMHLTVDQNVSANTTIMNQMNTDLPTIVQLLLPLRNQHRGGTVRTGATDINGPGNRVDVGPPPLTGTVVATKTITFDTIATNQAGTLFTVSGSLGNYTTVPILTYQDDGGPVQTFPVGSVITTTRFSFTHSGTTSGIHNLVVSDGPVSASTNYTTSPGVSNLPSVSFLTFGPNYIVPSNWNNNNNTIEGIGGGGSGKGKNGGTGGAYSKLVNFVATPGASIPVVIGQGGLGTTGNGNPGTDTTFNVNALIAKGGNPGLTAGGAIGGQASAGTGSVKFNGGNAPVPTAVYGAQGAGGAASPVGPGGNGAQGGSSPSGGGGGGGAGGGGDGQQPNSVGPGGLGGVGVKGGPGGIGGIGSANTTNFTSGTQGQIGTDWDLTHGAGGGGGGAGGHT